MSHQDIEDLTGVERRGGCPCRAQRPEVAGALTLHLECSEFVAVPGSGDHRIAQESLALRELRLPLVDVGRECRDLLFPPGQGLRGRDLLFVSLSVVLQFQAPILRLLLAQPPLLFAGVVLILAAVSSAATIVPARRAARVDPMLTLRVD